MLADSRGARREEPRRKVNGTKLLARAMRPRAWDRLMAGNGVRFNIVTRVSETLA
jgi:hypothetical protein